MLSFRSFIVLHFTCKVCDLFWVDFCEGCRSVPRFFFFFFFCIWMSNCSNYWKGYLCFIVLPLLLFQRSDVYTYLDLFLGSLFCSIELWVYFCTNTTQSWSWVVSGSGFVLLLQCWVNYSRSFVSPYKLENHFVDIHK